MLRQIQHNLKIIFAVGLLAAGPSLATAQPTGQPTEKPTDRSAPSSAPGSQASSPSGQPSSDKLDVSGLENKYWAAKDTDFNVVQNRLYSKANRWALTGSVGTLVNDPWTTGNAYNIDLAYYFNERWGVQLSYDATNSQDNQAVQRLGGQLGYPDHNQIQNFYGAQVNWVPFYAKMSILSWKIIYFDLSFGLGAGMQTYAQQKIDGSTSQSTPAVTFDVMQSFFLSKYFAIRVDLSNRWYSETTVKYNLYSGSHPSNGNDTNNATFLLLGLTFFY